MKALVKYGDRKGEVELREVPVPEVGDGDILLEVAACGICGSDIAFYDGHHVGVCRPPQVLGHEFAGVIAKVGRGVTRWKPGDRVSSDNTGAVCGTCYACSTGDFLVCPERRGLGYGMDGGFTKYVKISAAILARVPNTLFRVPDNVTLEHAAILDPAANAYRAVIEEGHLLPGEDIVVFGVGPIGLCAVQLARIAGADRIIAVGLADDGERFRVAKDLGATTCLAGDREDVAAAVREATGGAGAAVAVDAAGASSILQLAWGALHSNGRFVRVGFDETPLGYSLDPIVFKGISVKGHFGYSWAGWTSCLKLMAKGTLDMTPIISHRLGLDQWEKGFELTRTKKATKVVITP
jgi:threonine dehydrogenase-like Zn-dependent dehydrogenase